MVTKWDLALGMDCDSDLSLTCGTIHCGGDVENVVEERDNMDPKGDKVPLGNNRGATHGKLYLRR